MNIRRLLILFILGSAGAQTTYTVQAGDTLSSVARRYQTTPVALLTLNALPSTTIQVGQTLQLPPPPQHTVQAGETLYSIARQAGTTPEALIALNGLQNSTLQVGQTLRLTGGPRPSDATSTTPPVVTTTPPTLTRPPPPRRWRDGSNAASSRPSGSQPSPTCCCARPASAGHARRARTCPRWGLGTRPSTTAVRRRSPPQ